MLSFDHSHIENSDAFCAKPAYDFVQLLAGQLNVEKGFNSDIIYRGMTFHVQSEDWGSENPFIVSRVYQEGAIIKSVKTPYSELLGFGPGQWRRRPDPQAIRAALRDQHEKILDLLVSGQLF